MPTCRRENVYVCYGCMNTSLNLYVRVGMWILYIHEWEELALIDNVCMDMTMKEGFVYGKARSVCGI